VKPAKHPHKPGLPCKVPKSHNFLPVQDIEYYRYALMHEFS